MCTCPNPGNPKISSLESSETCLPSLDNGSKWQLKWSRRLELWFHGTSLCERVPTDYTNRQWFGLRSGGNGRPQRNRGGVCTRCLELSRGSTDSCEGKSWPILKKVDWTRTCSSLFLLLLLWFCCTSSCSSSLLVLFLLPSLDLFVGCLFVCSFFLSFLVGWWVGGF